MAMELHHLQTNMRDVAQKAMDVAGNAIDEISRLRAENERLKEMMPEYEQFIKDEDFKKKLVDEYAGYVYEWAWHRYVATPYINVFIKGILRALWLARAERAHAIVLIWNVYCYKNNCLYFRDFMNEKCNPFRSLPKKTAMEWSDLWESIETKLRVKAEEYK